jgi:hypothetical protein
MYPCPCCGYEVFGEPPGSFEICPICGWEDDLVQLGFPDLKGGANHVSLIEAQRTYAAIQSSKPQSTVHVRPPQDERRDPDWRPLDPLLDKYLKWENPKHHDFWHSPSEKGEDCLYYWRRDYWLRDRNVIN